MPCCSSALVEREDVAHVVVDDEHLAAVERDVVLAPVDDDLLVLRQRRDGPVQEQGRLVEEASRRSRRP